MLLHITDKCSMGCPHCLGDYKPDGEHMTEQVFRDSIEFILKTNPIVHIALTGGEPTEHPDFVKFMDILFDILDNTPPTLDMPHLVTITTNGFWCLTHPDEAKRIANGSKTVHVEWQVSADKRYYPIRLDVDNPLFKEARFTLCDDCVTRIYPQGRALDNKIPYQSKAPKCFNLRSVLKQLSLSSAVTHLLMRGFTCTPSIGINGDIKLGESKLCPSCASIYDDISTIENRIRNFHCHKCEFLLPKEMIDYINK